MMAGLLTVVGSGTVVPEGDRGGSCSHMEAGGVRLLVDCGPGAAGSMARHGVPWDRLTHLALTHFHGDHVGGLPALFFAFKHAVRPPREEPLEVLGPVGTDRLFRKLSDALGGYVTDPGFPVEIREVEPESEVELREGVTLRARETPHTDESLAYRVDASAPGASVGWTGDTGRAPELGSLFEEVDVLLAECSLPEEEVGDNHLSPSGVAEIASAARPGRLLLTHVYPHFRSGRDVPSLVRAAGFTGRVELARDGAVCALDEGGREGR